MKFVIKLGLARGLPRAGLVRAFDVAFMKKFLAVRSTPLTEPPKGGEAIFLKKVV